MGFSSCRQLVNDEFPWFEPRLALNALVTADSLITVHVSVAGQVTHDSLPVLEQATVLVAVDSGLPMPLTYKGKGLYVSDFKAQSLKTYRCMAQTNELGTATTWCKVPAPAILQNVTLDPYGWVNSDGEPSATIGFTIRNQWPDTLYFEAWVAIYSASVSETELKLYFQQQLRLGYFSNLNQPDSVIQKSFNIQPSSTNWYSRTAYVLYLRAVSPDYYHYTESLDLYTEGRYPDFTTGSAIPYNLYSNIENGYGIFAAYTLTLSDTLIGPMP